jgi:hypothetical protein
MSDHVGFVMDKAALGQAFSEFVDLLCQFSCQQLPRVHYLDTDTIVSEEPVASMFMVRR